MTVKGAELLREELKKEVVFSIEVARLEEQPRGNENVNETIATDANTTANDKHKMRELSSFFTKTFSAHRECVYISTWHMHISTTVVQFSRPGLLYRLVSDF